jgi:S-formylglutathione hydrolase FrmB
VKTNRKLAGYVVDHTSNHGKDRRIYSKALGQKRAMYVYLPPGYDPAKKYPLGIYMHGFLADEWGFLRQVVEPFDEAMACGKLPPMIIAAPDASPGGYDCLASTGTFYLNSRLGKFEDYFVEDVYRFLVCNYPIRPEPEAHALLGVSMGGGAAYRLVMRYRDKFGVAACFAPPLNLRWISCRGCYFDNFDPACWGWRTDFSDGRELVGVFFNGLVKIRMRTFLYPILGRKNPDMAGDVAKENPIELLDAYGIGPGFAEFYVAYGGQDEFNLDAQIESFLYRAKQRGVVVGVDYDPAGQHSSKTAAEMLPKMIDWLREKLEPYRPQ